MSTPERAAGVAVTVVSAAPTAFRRRAASSSVLQYATVGLVSLLNAATIVVLVRALSVADYGAYNVLTGLVVFANLMTSFGIGPLVQRFLPEYVATGRQAAARRLVGGLVALKVVVMLALSGVLLVTRETWLAWMNLPASVEPLVGLTLVIAVVAAEAQLLGDGVLVSLLDHAYWGAVRTGAAGLRLMLFAWGLYGGYGLPAVLGAWLVTELVLGVAYAARVWRRLASRAGETVGSADASLPLGRLARYGAYLYFHNVGFFFRDKTVDVFVIAYFLGTYEVGLYSVGFGIALLLLQFSPALQLRTIITSLMVERYVSDPSPATLQRFVDFFAKLTVFAGMPLFVIPAVLAREVIGYGLNREYAEVSGMFAASLLFVAVQQLAYVFGPALTTLERSDVIFWANLLAAYNLVMDFALIPVYGVWGAVLATGTGGVLLYVYYAVVARRLYGLSQPWAAYARCGVNLAIVALVLTGLRHVVEGVVSLGLVAGAGAVLYLVLSRVNRIFSPEERALMNTLLGRRAWVF